MLVLDDYHLVRDEAIHASVAFLLRHLPAHAASGDREPRRSATPARAACGRPARSTEIRAADLRFGDAEAEELLNGSLELGLEAADVELLQERTEGWAAGLQLAALSLRGRDDRRRVRPGFRRRRPADRRLPARGGRGRSPRPLREFLLRTSILERMCAPLCDAVTGRGDSAEQLGGVERSNLFLVALDNRGEWFRYHHLFRDLLRHELVRAEPELVPSCTRRAGGVAPRRRETSTRRSPMRPRPAISPTRAS